MVDRDQTSKIQLQQLTKKNAMFDRENSTDLTLQYLTAIVKCTKNQIAQNMKNEVLDRAKSVHI